MPASFKAEVQTDSTGKWYGNAVRWTTEAEAQAAAEDLFCRWTLVHSFRVAPSDDPPNYTLVDGVMTALPAPAPEPAPIEPAPIALTEDELRALDRANRGRHVMCRNMSRAARRAWAAR